MNRGKTNMAVPKVDSSLFPADHRAGRSSFKRNNKMKTAKDIKVGDTIETNWGRRMVVNSIEVTKMKNNKNQYEFIGITTIGPVWAVGKKTRENKRENTKIKTFEGAK